MRKIKFFSLFVATAMLIGFASCQDNDISDKDKNTMNAEMQVRISVANGDLSRANDEIGDGNETGIADEYLVNKATLYFFEAGVLKLDPMEFTGFQKDAAVVDNKVVWVSQNRKMDVGTYDVVIIVNGAAATTPAKGTTTLDDFLKDIKTGATTWITSASSGLLMASRDNSGAKVTGVTVDATNTPSNPAVVNAEVERTVAKIMLADGQTPQNDYNYSVNLGVTPPLTPTTFDIVLTDYRMLNLRDEFFTFRHTTTDFTPVNPGVTTDNVVYTFGNLADATSYIMDPRTFMKNTSMPVGVSGVTYTDWYVNRGFESVGDQEEHILGYCQENTMHKDAQKKGYGTAIVFKGKIISVDGVTITPGENLYYDRTNEAFYLTYADLLAAHTGLNATVNYAQLAANNIEAYKDGVCTYVYYIKHADNATENDMGIMEYAMVRNNVYKVAIEGISAPGKGLVPDPNDPTGETALDPADPTNPTDPDPTIDPAEDIETDEITVALKVKLTIKPWIIRNNNVILK